MVVALVLDLALLKHMVRSPCPSPGHLLIRSVSCLLSQAWKRIDSSIDHRKGDEIIVEDEVDNFEDDAIEVGLKATS